MNSPVRPSQPRVPSVAPTQNMQNQFYVYSTDNNHVGPVNAELIARGVLAGRVPNDAYVAPLGSTSWVPMATIPEIADAVQTARSTPSSMRPTALANGAPTVVSPPSPPVPRDLMTGPTVVATTPSPGAHATVVSPNPFAPTQNQNGPASVSPAAATQLAGTGPTPNAVSNGPASVGPTALSPAAPPVSQQPASLPQQPAAQPASAQMPVGQSGSPGFVPIQAPAAPAAQPAAPAPAPAPKPAAAPAAISPTPPVGGGEAKKEDKKPILDPRFKLLPLAIFGACAFIGVIETAIVLIAR